MANSSKLLAPGNKLEKAFPAHKIGDDQSTVWLC